MGGRGEKKIILILNFKKMVRFISEILILILSDYLFFFSKK